MTAMKVTATGKYKAVLYHCDQLRYRREHKPHHAENEIMYSPIHVDEYTQGHHKFGDQHRYPLFEHALHCDG